MSDKYWKDSLGNYYTTCSCGKTVWLGKNGGSCLCGKKYNSVGQEIVDSDYYNSDMDDYY